MTTSPGPASPEAILASAERRIELLVGREDITVTRAHYAAGLDVAGPHVHHGHTDAFYVLEGVLVFEVGHDREEVSVAAGGCLAVPPHVPHAFRVDAGAPARWLTLHAPDGGFAAFMRGVRDGAAVEWDVHPVERRRPGAAGALRHWPSCGRSGCGALLWPASSPPTC